jgi:hypothetical protein
MLGRSAHSVSPIAGSRTHDPRGLPRDDEEVGSISAIRIERDRGVSPRSPPLTPETTRIGRLGGHRADATPRLVAVPAPPRKAQEQE